VNDIVWSDDGNRYAFCTHDGKVTARDVASGKDLLDIQLPHRANQVTFIGGDEGMFLAAACDDGSLPVFLIEGIDDGEEQDGMRRAIMAIEPVVGPSAGDERFKCIRSVKGGSGFLVVTANSGGSVSLIDLESAAQMIMDGDDEENIDDDEEEGEEVDDDDEIQAQRPDERGESADDESEEERDEDDDALDLAAEILDSVKLGSGARITCLSVWSSNTVSSDNVETGEDNQEHISKILDESEDPHKITDPVEEQPFSKKRNKNGVKERAYESRNAKTMDRGLEEMDEESLEKARALVKQAKKHQKRLEKKKSKSSKSN
jgi:WD40 repeat protein